jgi:hypothetical protein
MGEEAFVDREKKIYRDIIIDKEEENYFDEVYFSEHDGYPTILPLAFGI